MNKKSTTSIAVLVIATLSAACILYVQSTSSTLTPSPSNIPTPQANTPTPLSNTPTASVNTPTAPTDTHAPSSTTTLSTNKPTPSSVNSNYIGNKDSKLFHNHPVIPYRVKKTE